MPLASTADLDQLSTHVSPEFNPGAVAAKLKTGSSNAVKEPTTFAASVHDRPFGSENGLLLVGSQPVYSINRVIEEPVKCILAFALEQFRKCRRGMKVGNLPGNKLDVPRVEVPNQLSIGCIKEGHSEAIPVAGANHGPMRISLGLLKDVLRVDRDLLGFDDAKQLATDKQRIVCGAVLGGKLLHCHLIKSGYVQSLPVPNDFPTGIGPAQLLVDALLAGFPFWFVRWHTSKLSALDRNYPILQQAASLCPPRIMLRKWVSATGMQRNYCAILR